MFGPALFAAVVLALSAVEYDFMLRIGWQPLGDPGGAWPSGLALGPYGWALTASFAVSGILLMIFAVGLHFGMPGDSRIGPAFLWAAGAAMALMAFETDPIRRAGLRSLHGWIHDAAFVLFVLALLPAFFFLWWRLRKDPRWRGHAVYTLITGLLATLLIFLPGVAYYLFLAVVLAWVSTTGARLRKHAPATTVSGSRPPRQSPESSTRTAKVAVEPARFIENSSPTVLLRLKPSLGAGDGQQTAHQQSMRQTRGERKVMTKNDQKNVPRPRSSGSTVDASVEAPPTSTNEYAELKAIVKRQGLLDKQPAYYARIVLLTSGMLALSGVLLVVTDNLWLQILNAVYLAFVFTQVAFIGHDLSHRQIFRSERTSAIFGLVVANLILGMSRGWWVDKHNRHHANPNHDDLDPDINIPVLAFSEEQALSKRGLARFVVKHQAYLFFPLLTFEAIHMRTHSIEFLVQKKPKYLPAEVLLLMLHLALYLGLLFYFLAFWQAVLFIVVHQAFFGLYLGSVFAPNHKGMPVLDKDSRMSFLRRQVLTSRNLKANRVTDFLFGPLGCQIEHHLFPTMPRNNQRKVEKIVKVFCRERSVAYHEAGVLQSYREILQHLHEVGAPLRDVEGTLEVK